jgi:hypothetical protein
MKSPSPVAEGGLATETPGTKPRATIVNANKPARKTVSVVMMIIASSTHLYVSKGYAGVAGKEKK